MIHRYHQILFYLQETYKSPPQLYARSPTSKNNQMPVRMATYLFERLKCKLSFFASNR